MGLNSSLPPGPKLSRSKQYQQFMSNPINFFDTISREFNQWATVRFLGQPTSIFTSDLEAFDAVFKANHQLLHAGEAAAVFKPILGESGLIVLDGERHLKHRRCILPAFHGKTLLNYFDVVLQITTECITNWPKQRYFNALAAMQEITLRIMIKLIFGINEEQQANDLYQLLLQFLDSTNDPAYRMLMFVPELRENIAQDSIWHKTNKTIEDVNKILFNEITRRRKQGSESQQDILSHLINVKNSDGNYFSDCEIRDEVMTLLLAGHETTALTLSWCLYHVLKQPAIKQLISTEIKSVTNNQVIKTRNLAELNYLTASIKETLRIMPVIPWLNRIAQSDFTINKYTIPSKMMIRPIIYSLHHRADLWRDPQQFNPERFLSKAKENNHYAPYGGGTRRCVGANFAMLEMQVILHEIFRRCDLRLQPDYSPTAVVHCFPLAPSGGVPIIIDLN